MQNWHWRVLGEIAVASASKWRVFADRRAVTAVEYAIIAGIMVVALVLSVPFIAPELATIFNKVGSEL
jgi:Flp pilus assembly pilin Flp